MIKYLMTALAFVAPFTPAHQVHDDFTTFETASYFNDAFGDLTGYSLTYSAFIEDEFEVDFDNSFSYMALPIYYDVLFSEYQFDTYYSNEYFNFYLITQSAPDEYSFYFIIDNYVGIENGFPFGYINSIAMTTYINNELPSRLTGGIIGTISEWVTGSIGILVAGLTSFVSVFYNSTTSELTAIGILALLGLAVGLVTLIIAFVRRLFER